MEKGMPHTTYKKEWTNAMKATKKEKSNITQRHGGSRWSSMASLTSDQEVLHHGKLNL